MSSSQVSGDSKPTVVDSPAVAVPKTADMRTADMRTGDLKMEAVVIPVADVDRARQFYDSLGWRLDADFSAGQSRIVQYTPPGSGCSLQFGAGLTTAAPGSAQGLYLVVTDIQAARDALVARGVSVSPVFHCETGFACRFGDDSTPGRVTGRAPADASYGSFAGFSDPDGNGWLLQEVTTRLPGRVDATTTQYASVADVASALRRAAAAHGEHEARTGKADPDWPDWYALYMVREQSGETLPS